VVLPRYSRFADGFWVVVIRQCPLTGNGDRKLAARIVVAEENIRNGCAAFLSRYQLPRLPEPFRQYS